VLRSVLAWVVAGLTWPAAWFALPLVGLAAFGCAKPLARVVAQRKQAEEVAWSDHTAQLEEAVAGRDDVRSSLGQPHVIRQYALRGQELVNRVRARSNTSALVMLRTGLVLHLLLAVLAIAGVALVSTDRLSVAEPLTLWLLATAFIGQLSRVADHLPDLRPDSARWPGSGPCSRPRRSQATAPRCRAGHPRSTPTRRWA
jgi:ATP-binding cassette, subfamily B, bacterial